MTSTEALVQLLSQAAPKQKIYPDVVPAEVQPPFVAYSEESQSNTTFDGNGGDVDTTVVTVVAQTKREARELATAWPVRSTANSPKAMPSTFRAASS